MEQKKTTNKRGVSPLIASVLLIAFTVAMGAIIMTWGRGFVSDQTNRVDSETSTSAACATSVAMDIMVINDQKDVCYGANTGVINFTIQNTGTENIKQLRLTTMDGVGNVYNNITDMKTPLSTGNAVRIAIKIAPSLTSVKALTLYPVIQPVGLDTNRTCSNFQLDVANLRAC